MADPTALMTGHPSPSPPLRRFTEELAALRGSSEAQIITTAQHPFPIVAINPPWTRLCGYSEEALGQTCKILQGPNTSGDALRMLHGALRRKRRITVRLLNYTKEGKPFHNDLSIEPLTDDHDRPTHFLGTLRPFDDSMSVDEYRTVSLSPDTMSWRNSLLDQYPSSVEEALALDEPVVLTEAHHPFAITHVNDKWCRTCEYSVEEAIGRTCSILQGADTCTSTLATLMNAAKNHLTITVRLLNFTQERLVPAASMSTIRDAHPFPPARLPRKRMQRRNAASPPAPPSP
jgi:PAS domain S-box-containing protein